MIDKTIFKKEFLRKDSKTYVKQYKLLCPLNEFKIERYGKGKD